MFTNLKDEILNKVCVGRKIGILTKQRHISFNEGDSVKIIGRHTSHSLAWEFQGCCQLSEKPSNIMLLPMRMTMMLRILIMTMI